MTTAVVILLALSVLCDVAGQLCFKAGVDRLERRAAGAGNAAFLLLLPRSPLLLAGIAVYLVEIAVWLLLLARAPLSLAFPLASLNYCGILFASRLVLGEPVGRRRWIGVSLVTAGVVLVGATA